MLGASFLAGCVWENEDHTLYPNITEWEQEDHTSYPNITEMVEPASATSGWTDIRIEKAVDWAEKMVGKSYPKNTGYYFRCLQFVQDAYNQTGTPVPGGFVTAANAAQKLNATANKNNVPPPKGAWVFYDWVYERRNYGHVALSIGNGKVIHSLTIEKKGIAVIREDAYDKIGITYIGWAWPILFVNPPTLPNGSVNADYKATVSVSEGTPPYTWGWEGTPPRGLTLTFPHAGDRSVVTITGTPTRSGIYRLTVTDKIGRKAFAELSIVEFKISPTTQNFDAQGGHGQINVEAGGNVTWTAQSTVPWIRIASGGTGTGNGVITYIVDPNCASRGSRTGTIKVLSQIHRVTQRGDTVNPSAPGNLTARSTLEGLDVVVDLSWQAASDNCCLNKYQIYRDGKLLAEVSPNSLTFRDTTVKIGRVYRYRVYALDAAGNRSAPSNEVQIRALPLPGVNVAEVKERK
jgi:cell wall-associated NlpC family hydrolase